MLSILVFCALSVKIAAGFLLAVILYLVVNPINRWKYRHIPGPPYRAVFGNLPEFKKYGSHEFMAACRAKYGPVFKVWFGHSVWLVVADPDMGKRVNYKCINRPRTVGDPLLQGPATKDENKGLFFSRDDTWRLLHKVWQPAFYAESVHACAPLMTSTTRRLVDRLKDLAAAGQPVDIWREVGNLTMAIVGTTAYGIDFHTIKPAGAAGATQPCISSSSGSSTKAGAISRGNLPRDAAAHFANAAIALDQGDVGAKLVDAAQTLFASVAATNGSIYQRLAMLLPAPLKPLMAKMAASWPDAPFKQVLAARATMSSASMQLIEQYRQKQQQGPSSRGGASTDTAAASAGAAAGGAGGAGGGMKRWSGAIAPGSFLGLLLSARDSATGHALSDLQLIMQANTFTLAGYETTASALAFSLFCVSTHPEVEAKVLQEAAAAGSAPFHTHKDLEQQFPYTCAVVTEALRLYPPGASTVREVGTTPLQLGCHTLPPGSTVFVASYVIQRDPELWPRAAEFLPERWLPGNEHLAAKHPSAYLPFGSGGRMCVGQRFALQEVRLGLLELLTAFHFEVQWELMVPPANQCAEEEQGLVGLEGQQEQQEQDSCSRLRTVNGFTLSPAGGIWVKVQPRICGC